MYFNECRKKLGDVPLHVAVDFYLKLNGSASSSKTLDETWDEFIRELQHRQLSDRHIATSKSIKKMLSPFFGERRERVAAFPYDERRVERQSPGHPAGGSGGRVRHAALREVSDPLVGMPLPHGAPRLDDGEGSRLQ